MSTPQSGSGNEVQALTGHTGDTFTITLGSDTTATSLTYGTSTASDLATKSASKPAPAKGGKVAVKYRNAATGDTWSGRGLQPKWLKAALAAGRKIEEFAVKP